MVNLRVERRIKYQGMLIDYAGDASSRNVIMMNGGALTWKSHILANSQARLLGRDMHQVPPPPPPPITELQICHR
jgi:hypothetical protein